MPDIDIHHAHSLAHDDARHAVQEVAEKLSERFGLKYGWSGDDLNFSATGVDGTIALVANELHVTAKLGFLMSSFKGPIESEIRRVLSERFA